MRTDFISKLIEVLEKSEWYMGYLSLIDFILYELLFYFQGYCPEIISHPVFEQYMTRF